MNDREQEIKQVASKLLQGGLAKSHMDAMKMAESMVTTDMTPSGRKIDNLKYAEETPKEPPMSVQSEAPVNTTYNLGVDVNENMSVNDLIRDPEEQEVADEVREEILEVEKTPNRYPDDSAESQQSDSVAKEDLESEIKSIESEPESEIEEKQEQEIESELDEPEYLETEGKIISEEETEEGVKEELSEILSEPDAPNESEADEMLNEPEDYKKEEEIILEEEKELEEESHVEPDSNVDIEVVDIEDGDSEDITKMF